MALWPFFSLQHCVIDARCKHVVRKYFTDLGVLDESGQAVLSSSVFPLQRTFDRPAAAERLRRVVGIIGER